MNKTGGITIAAWALLGAASAHAQVAAAPERRFDVGVQVQGVYDSNITHTSRELASLRGLELNDYRVTPSITIDAALPVGRQVASLRGLVGYDIYARNSRLDSERVSLDGAFGFQLSRCNGALTANYARRQSELGDLFFVTPIDGTVTTRVRNREDIKSIGLSGSCGAQIGLRPTASVQQTWVDNSSGLRRIADYNSTAYTAGIAYSQPTFGLLTLFGSYNTVSYPSRSAFLGVAGDDGFDSKGGGVRFERSIGSRIRGLVEVSYTSTDSSRDVSDFSGLTFRGQIAHQVSNALLWTFDLSRAVQPSNRVDANYSVEQLYSFNANYALSERAGVNVAAIWQDRDYRGGFIFLGPSLVNDKLRSITVGGRYRLIRKINLTLSGTREWRNANGTIFDYNSTRITTGVSTVF